MRLSRCLLNSFWKVNQNGFTFSRQDFLMNLNGFTLKFIRIYMAVRFDYYRFGVDMFCKHSMWSSTCTFLGRTPAPLRSLCVNKKGSRRIKRLAFYFEKCKFFTSVSHARPPIGYFTTRLFLRSTLETDCWCGGINCWTGWSSKRSIKPKTRTRRLSGLMNSFVVVPVVVFVSRKETMHRERHI